MSKAHAIAAKDRPDVSFLHEKTKMLVSQGGGSKNILLESKNGALISQS